MAYSRSLLQGLVAKTQNPGVHFSWYTPREMPRKPKKVLVVDDEAPVRTTLTKFLRSIGVEEILEAANGEEAVRLVRGAPDIRLILLDLKMPVMDGVQALEQIRAIAPEVKIVLLTGYPFYAEADAVVQKWALSDFLVKPVDLDYLERLVSTVLSD